MHRRLMSVLFDIPFHRKTTEIHDLGFENWHNVIRAKRIRSSIPSKLTITMFGSEKTSETAPAEPPHANDDADSRIAEPGPETPEPPSAIRVHQPDQLPMSVTEWTTDQICEGWAPPSIALHGPKFRIRNDSEKSDLVKLHKNLGHPDPEHFAIHLQNRRSSSRVCVRYLRGIQFFPPSTTRTAT